MASGGGMDWGPVGLGFMEGILIPRGEMRGAGGAAGSPREGAARPNVNGSPLACRLTASTQGREAEMEIRVVQKRQLVSSGVLSPAFCLAGLHLLLST